MRRQYAVTVVMSALVVLLGQPPLAEAQSVERMTYVLMQALERNADPRREPDWGVLQQSMARFLQEDPTGNIAVLAQRTAAAVNVRMSDPVSSVADPASLSIDSSPRFPIEGLHYVVTIETSLDAGPWRPMGWARYPGGGCGTKITGVFSQTELRPGWHRLDVRANFFMLDPRDWQDRRESEPPCGFVTAEGTPRWAQSLPDLSELKVLWRESRPTAGLTFGLSNEQSIEDVRLAPSSALPNSHGAALFELAARNASVRSLDERLPDLSLDEWLELTLLPWKPDMAETRWYVHDCREGRPDTKPVGETLLCAEALAPVNDDKRLFIRLRVGRVVEQQGTWRWLEMTPTLEDVYLEQGNNSLDIARLGDVPDALSVPFENWPTAELEMGPGGITIQGPQRVPVAGDVIPLVFHVRNNGTRDAKNAILKASLRPSGDRDKAVEHQVRLDVPAGRTTTTAWTVQLPSASDWSVVATAEQDYIVPKRAPFEPDSVNNSAILELGAVPADRLRMIEEWLAYYRTRP